MGFIGCVLKAIQRLAVAEATGFPLGGGEWLLAVKVTTPY